jgi:hypothetical protein
MEVFGFKDLSSLKLVRLHHLLTMMQQSCVHFSKHAGCCERGTFLATDGNFAVEFYLPACVFIAYTFVISSKIMKRDREGPPGSEGFVHGRHSRVDSETLKY